MKTLTRLLAGFLGLLLFGIVVFAAANWEPDRPAAELRARWAQPPSQFLDIAGMLVHVRDEGASGDPVPIVLIHGTSSNLHTWTGWVRRLEGNRRVVTFDLPGFGLTGPSPDDNYTIAAYVRFLRLLLDRLGIQHCLLAGN